MAEGEEKQQHHRNVQVKVHQPEAVLDHNIGRRFDARTARREFELARRCVVFGSKRLNGLYYSVQRVGFVISQVSDDRGDRAGTVDQIRSVTRSEERRVGNEWGSTCRSRWSAYL